MTIAQYGLDAFFQNSGTSPKMVWNINGVLGFSPHNLCLRSQEFEQTTPWNPTTAVTVTTNATAAPDGTITADKLVETATSSNHQILHSTIAYVVGATYTMSVYAKAAERTWLSITATNAVAADWFDLAAGVVGTSANGGVITAAGGGWYRCSITFVKDAAAGGPVIFIRTSNGQVSAYTGDGISGLYVWGAQLNRGSVALPYIPTTTAARMGLAVDYHPSSHAALGLLSEPAATNLLLNSQVLSTQSVTVSAVAYTLSFLGTGTVTLSGASVAGPLVGTGVSNRVSLTFTPTAGSLTLTVTGTVSDAQLETGSIATSPIRTFAAAATRAADNYSFQLAAIPDLGSEYSIYCRFATPLPTNSRHPFVVTDGTVNEFAGFLASTTRLDVVDSGVAVGAITGPALSAEIFTSAAARLKLNDAAMSVDGGAVVVDATVTLPTVSEVRFGGVGSNAASSAVFRLQKMVIVPVAWDDAKLAMRSVT